MLYVSAGDGASSTAPTTAQIEQPVRRPAGRRAAITPPTAQGGALRAQTFRRPRRPAASLDGAILRVNPDTVRPRRQPAIGTPIRRRRIVAYGFRNPFRFTFRPGHGRDLGRATSAGTRGRRSTASRTPRRSATTAGPATRAPAAGGPTTRSTSTTARRSTRRARRRHRAVLHLQPRREGRRRRDLHDRLVVDLRRSPSTPATTFPAAYKDALFFSDYSRNCIWVMCPGADGLPDPAHAPDVRRRGRRPGVPHPGPGRRAVLRRPRRRHDPPHPADEQRADGAHRGHPDAAAPRR